MYTREEASKIKQEFWTAFGRYMKPVLNADGEKVNWSNYKTGVPGIRFKMDADKRTATITIIMNASDTDRQQAFFQLFQQLKTMLEEQLEENDWLWEEEAYDEFGRPQGIISKQLNGVNIFLNKDWPNIISFLKPRIIALDAFWSMAKYSFQELL